MQPTVDPHFYRSLVAEDELGVVVRAHIHVEASIIEFLEATVPYPKLLPRLNYEARLRLACALGLDSDHFDSFKALGDLRNSFGHNLTATITDAKVNELFSKLPPIAKEAVLGAYATSIVCHDDMPVFQKLRPKDRFVFIAVGLKMFALNAAHQAKSGSA